LEAYENLNPYYEKIRRIVITTANKFYRPTSIPEMLERFECLHSQQIFDFIEQFVPKPSDIFISPFPKSGTTWLQQIVHGLRSQGSMEFSEISLVVPFIERAKMLGIELNAPQVAEPRAFKSHLPWDKIPKGGRYIISIRNPKDVLVSSYRFAEGYFFEPGSISISVFGRENFIAKRRYWRHLASWWEQRDNPDILFLSYELMRAELPKTIQKIAEFINIELTSQLLELLVKQSSIEFMRAHKGKFDDPTINKAVQQLCELPPPIAFTKIRQGKVDRYQNVLSNELSAKIDLIWQEEIETKFGIPSYEALLELLAERF